MEFVERADDRPKQISIARCRELLGDEAESMTDQDVASKSADTRRRWRGSWSRCIWTRCRIPE